MQNHTHSNDTLVFSAIMVVVLTVVAVISYLTLSGKIHGNF